jgi:hypothetical protein
VNESAKVFALLLYYALNATGAPKPPVSAAAAPQHLFAGVNRVVSVKLHNELGASASVALRVRLLQTTTATTTTIGEQGWKQVQLAPGQTILERITLDFPAVRAETRFLLQWIEGGSNIVGQTQIRVYPTNLLAQLQDRAGVEPLGVFDPNNALKPLLRMQAVAFQDLLEEGMEKFRGKLAICGPFETKAQMQERHRDDIRALAKRGVAVVWLQPPTTELDPFKPSFYVVREHPGAVVVAAHELTAGLAEGPQAQLNLVQLAEAALQPTPWELPEIEASN